MEDIFNIEVEVDGEMFNFQARLDAIGFVHKIHIIVNGKDVVYEPDEERNYRAIIKPEHTNALTAKDKEIIIALAEALEKLR